MNGGNEGPDKRTTAYENIFGRPTAKPKGPNNAFPSANGIAPNLTAVNQWASQTAYLANQQTPRYNGVNPAVGPSQPYRGPQQVYGYGPNLAQPNLQPDMIDRRTSMTPSMSSHDPRMSSYFGPGGSNLASAADAYGGSSNLTGGGGYYQQPATPYHRSNSSPASGSRPLPSIQAPHLEGASYRQRQPSNPNLPPYVRQPSIPASSPPPAEDNTLMKSAPRLPSFDLGAEKSAIDDPWFTNGNGYANVGNKNGSTSAVSPTLPQEEIPVSPDVQSMTLYSESTDKEDTAIADEGRYRNGECSTSIVLSDLPLLIISLYIKRLSRLSTTAQESIGNVTAQEFNRLG